MKAAAGMGVSSLFLPLMSRIAYVRGLFSAFLWLQCLPISLALKGDSACRSAVCVVGTVENDVVTYEVTAMLEPLGWVALGFGSHMPNTPSVIFWKDKKGETVMSQRYATGYSEPHVDSSPPRIAKLVDVKHILPAPASAATFAFQLPANTSILSSSQPVEPHVFAFSAVPPLGDLENIATNLPRHQHVGYMVLDFTKDFVAPAPHKPSHHGTLKQGTNLQYSRMEKLIVLHGFVVSVGFLVLLPAGSLIARYGRAFTPKWFKSHRLTNSLIAGPVITLGVTLGPAIVFSKKSFRIHLANTHEIFGILLLFLYWAQVLLGSYIHKRRNILAKQGPVTRPHPPLNILHIVLGVSIISLAFLQVRSGLEWWETLTGRGPITPWAWPLWNIWSIVLFLAYFGGYALLPRQFRLEREASYVAVPAAPDRETRQHLLAEEQEP